MVEELPNWRRKKVLLWGEGATAEKQKETGDAFFRVARLPEALEFYLRAKAEDGIGKVLEEAVTRGDWFLFKACRGYFGKEFAEELGTLARNAGEQGKFLYAVKAYMALGDKAAAAEMLQKLREVYPEAEILTKSMEEEIAGAPEDAEPGSKPETKGKEKGKKT